MSISKEWWCVLLGHAWELVAFPWPHRKWVCTRCGKVYKDTR